MNSNRNLYVIIAVLCVCVGCFGSMAIRQKLSEKPTLTAEQLIQYGQLKKRAQIVQAEAQELQEEAKGFKEARDKENSGYQFDLQSGDFIPIPKGSSLTPTSKK